MPFMSTVANCLWGRIRVENNIDLKVEGIQTIYAGHSILQNADWYSNHRIVDTGGYIQGRDLHFAKN